MYVTTHNKIVSGLQVLDKNEQWLDIPVVNKKNVFVINAGTWIQMITNDHWLAAVHRVIKKSNDARLSLAMFSGASKDTLIEPLKGCKVCSEKEFNYKHLKGTTLGQYVENLLNNAAGKSSAQENVNQ